MASLQAPQNTISSIYIIGPNPICALIVVIAYLNQGLVQERGNFLERELEDRIESSVFICPELVWAPKCLVIVLKLSLYLAHSMAYQWKSVLELEKYFLIETIKTEQLTEEILVFQNA